MHDKYQFRITFLTQLFWLKRAPLKGNTLYKIMGGDFFLISDKGAILKMSFGNPGLTRAKVKMSERIDKTYFKGVS